ncbi:6-pyruvoyl-tetrahydropterin synthase-related protein [uncultured Caulobacter sp.]|uniref:6-pyruvoyl-tetrahydropterin synthase-related protein n=1 Tax=uncultured Caulobacter sp. TaxID=158749 RepID=UPI002610501C|nr:6-pyruvoyl-tetrahydropterin synthase-related protein [uncultured Caulobacter sp.]
MKALVDKLRGWPLAVLVISLATAVLLHKPLVQGTGWSHSYFFNASWVLGFNDALQRGEFPPRWLHDGFNGLGAPSFYYYPPLAFYVTALVRGVAGPGMDHSHLMAWGAYLTTAASGLAMFAWLRDKAGAGWALAGALAYVFAPYHQIDDFVRGAMGETTAYAAVPLVMLTLERTARSRRWIPGLGFAFAALILSHLVIAMLVSVSVLSIYAAWLVLTAPKAERAAVVLRCGAGALLGVAMAASYLGPATLMQSYASLQWMWNAGAYDPYNWALLRPDLWPFRPFSVSMAWLGWGTGALGLAAVLAAVGRTLPAKLAEAALWGGITLFGLLLYALPWVWHGPTGLLLGKAQFAYRILLGMEFAAVTGVVLAAAGGRWVRLLVLVPLCLIPLKHGYDINAGDIRMHLVQNGDLSDEIRGMIAARRTPQEHLPQGVDIASPRFADPSLMSGFSDVPMAAAKDPGAQITKTGVMPDGTVVVIMRAARPTLVVLHRFYYPTWHAYRVQPGRDPEVAVEASGGERLLAFRADAGVNTYRIRIERSPLEKVCDTLSLLAILVGLALLAPSLMEGLKKFRKAAI